MKTPSSPWRLFMVLAAFAPPAFGQRTSANGPMPLTRTPAFTMPYLMEKEVDAHPRADKELSGAVGRITEKIINSRPDLCIAGSYRARIEFVVDTDGTPKEVQWVAANNAEYADIEVTAVQHLHFSPATLNGRAVPCLRSLTQGEYRPQSFQATPVAFSADPYSPQNLAAFSRPPPDNDSFDQTVAGSSVRAPMFALDYLRQREVSQRPLPNRDFNQEVMHEVVVQYHQNGLDPWRGGGMARLAFVVDVDGTPRNVQWIETTNPGYAGLMVSAISRFKFSPALLDGRAVPCLQVMSIRAD